MITDNMRGLAQAFMAGDDVEFALHDELIEQGYPGTAYWHFGAHRCRPGWPCTAIALILGLEMPEWLGPEQPPQKWLGPELPPQTLDEMETEAALRMSLDL